MFSRELSQVARRVAGRLGIGFRGIMMMPAMGVDASRFNSLTSILDLIESETG